MADFAPPTRPTNGVTVQNTDLRRSDLYILAARTGVHRMRD
jgi:hypothetical protein